jgi:hypothetical protein
MVVRSLGARDYDTAVKRPPKVYGELLSQYESRTTASSDPEPGRMGRKHRVDSLAGRLQPSSPDAPAVCTLDTGPDLRPSIASRSAGAATSPSARVNCSTSEAACAT